MNEVQVPALSIEEVEACELCPKLGRMHVPAHGCVGAELMIVGQSPGHEEVKKKQPFVGPSGRLLTWFLDELALTREEVYITNVLKCKPPRNRPGAADEIKACKARWLSNELKAVRPSVILLLGGDAHKAIMPKKYAFADRASTRTKNRSYVTLYHPSYWLRRQQHGKFLSGASVVREELEHWRTYL